MQHQKKEVKAMLQKVNELIKRLETVENDYKPIPFWSWNGKLEKQELIRQIRWMRQTNNGGFFMHARSGLKTQYLSDEWMQCIEACAEEAGDMQAWVYDENGWPSGFAGGKLLENAEDRDRYLSHWVGSFDPTATVSYYIDNGALVRTKVPMQGKTHLNVTVHSAASTADVLNPAVTDKFLKLTHETYKERFGAHFSEKITGFFTDEPQYQRWHTPYTTMVADYFREHYGQDIFDHIGLLFVEANGYRTFRYRYWSAMQQLLLNNFSKKVYDWCENNHVKLTGHYVEETSMGYQIMCCAGVMPFYEYEHIPGIDWLGVDTDHELSPRQVGSAACQLGKQQVITETFGCCGHQVTPRDLRRILGFQYVNGVNLLCHHLIPYVENGHCKRDHPAHYSPKNPWVKESFAEFNLYVARLRKLLACSTEPVNVALLHPIRSGYFDYKRDLGPGNEFGIGQQEEIFRQDCRMFSANCVAYHFIDETLLAKHGFVKDGKIGCGKCSYDYLVLPHILTMDASTEKLLREYVAGGGKLLILGDAPTYLEGEPYNYDYLKSNCSFEQIVAAQPVKIHNSQHRLYCSYRICDSGNLLMVQNADGKQAYTQTFRLGEEIRSFMKLDLQDLSVTQVPLTVKVEAGETLLLIPSTEPFTAKPTYKEVSFTLNQANVSFSDNYLTLDMVRYSVDGVHYSHPYPCRGLFQKLLWERYEGDLYLKYDFTVREVPEQITLLAETCSVGEQWFNGKPLTVTPKGEPTDHTWQADVTSLIRPGENDYTVKIHWHQNEQVYYALFGENVTESLKNCIVYDSDLEAVYLSGKFGVYSDQSFTDDGEYTFGEDFYIGKVPQKVTEPVTEGFPFFRGRLTVCQMVSFDEDVTHLRLNGTYQSADVHMNGQYAGKLLFDRVLDIRPYKKDGENEIRVDYIISNRNLLGPHHYIDKSSRNAVGPYVWELTNAWVKDEKTGYRSSYELLKLCASKEGEML